MIDGASRSLGTAQEVDGTQRHHDRSNGPQQEKRPWWGARRIEEDVRRKQASSSALCMRVVKTAIVSRLCLQIRRSGPRITAAGAARPPHVPSDVLSYLAKVDDVTWCASVLVCELAVRLERTTTVCWTAARAPAKDMRLDCWRGRTHTTAVAPI